MRGLTRLLALATALALAGVGAIVAIEAALLASDREPWVVPRQRWARGLADLTWDDGALQVAAGVTAVAGAVVVLLQVVPRRPRRFAVAGTPGRDVWLAREGVQRRVARAVIDAHDEVAAARVRAGRRRVAVQGTVVAASDATTPARVHATATAALARLDLARQPSVKVRLARNRTRVR